MPSHFRNWILSITTFGFAVVLVVGASAKPVQKVTNPYTAKQVQAMLHPSATATPYAFLQNFSDRLGAFVLLTSRGSAASSRRIP